MASHHIETLRSFEGGVTSNEILPVYYGIEVTRHCNLACIMCPHPSFSKDDKGHMDVDVFKLIIKKIAPFAKLIKLHWVGEPLLHPRIIEMIAYAKEQSNARIQMSTNASLLKGDLAIKLRLSGLDMLTISLDGNSAATYENIRRKGHFNRVVSNVEGFLDDVRRNGGPFCHVKMILFRENEGESEAFKERWGGHKNVAVDIMWLSDWAGSVPGLESKAAYLNPVGSSKREPCSDLWFKMQINWNGKVALCCFDANNTVTMGDLVKESVPDIWNSPIAEGVRKDHLLECYKGICQSCKDWAKPSEYEFWYSLEEIAENPQQLWG